MINDINWNELWKEEMLNASWHKQKRNMVEFWDNKAKIFNENIKKHNDRKQRIISKLNVRPNDKILDIGAGTGAISVPLAKIAKHVTAVEPSGVMLDFLQENAKRENLNNISLVNKKWEDVESGRDIDVYDVVFASYSIVMPDIKDALIKMDQSAKRSVYLFTFAGRTHDKLWTKLNGEKFIPGPDYIYIVNVLYQLGIFANVEILEHDFKQTYTSLDEAVMQSMQHYGEQSPSAEKLIREYFVETLKEKDGVLCFMEKRKSSTIWWEK